MNQENNAVLSVLAGKMVTKTFSDLLIEYYKMKEANPYIDIRLGQYFCNLFIKSQWSVLFYEDDDKVSERIIYKYMLDNQWTGSLESYHIKHVRS